MNITEMHLKKETAQRLENIERMSFNVTEAAKILRPLVQHLKPLRLTLRKANRWYWPQHRVTLLISDWPQQYKFYCEHPDWNNRCLGFTIRWM